ncbi:putative exported domain protein [Janthinobacterium agaricidamnosum NBRC 102515 = DSM 9628]|uniref:Putative exported domain protein n=1 Tax=Janthinobacterium agaricidamnosum NBRC 102515 = DSM 9628 TaxID=1349767 RepID=W0V244_9BURK|nr:putative exported domain protein [Janthinobacterium agaricidamnosum NBRC 102515 = DSM 9628]
MPAFLPALLPVLLPLLFSSMPAQAAPFYTGKTLAHPAISAAQDSAADIAFIKEKDGVNGYYCECAGSSSKPLLLDKFGTAVIRSVFYAALDREADNSVQTMLVLLRQGDRNGLRAYRYERHSGRYRRLDDLQPALDRIAAQGLPPNAGQVKAALARLAPMDYSVQRGKSGDADIDAIDHTLGSVVGYYDDEDKPVAAGDKHAVTYKKSFQKKGDRYLTASYTLYSDLDAGTLPNYRLWQVTWETAPQQFSGSEEGPAVIYSRAWDDGAVIERGQFRNGKREGLWLRDGMHEGRTKGGYVNGLPEGPWHIESPRQTEDGLYRNGKREGRWTIANYADEDEATGFDTYVAGQLNGPHERSIGGKLRERGVFGNGTRQGPWLTEEGSGSYVDSQRDGPWKLRLKDGAMQSVRYVKGRKQGEVIDTDAEGALRLRDHYQADVLDGARTRYLGPAGKEVVVYTATFRNGQLDGREQAFDDSGKILRLDTLWDHGKKNGLDARYYPDGKPERLADIQQGRLATRLRDYYPDGTLLNDIRRCYFTEDGRERDGVCDYHRTYFPDGTPEYDYVFLYGDRQQGRTYYKNGKVQQELLVDRAADTSVFNTYYESGQLKCTEPRRGHGKRTVNGQAIQSYGAASRDGDSICYHPNGKMSSIRSYSKRLALNCGKQFDTAGKQTFPGPEGCPPVRKVPFIFGE